MTASLKSIRFLLVDDSPYMMQIVAEVLRSLGAQRIVQALDIAAAEAALEAEALDIIILDLKIGAEDGLEFLRNVRSDKRVAVRYLPVIILSASSEVGSVTAARDAGATEFCQKPITVTQLLRKLEAVIDAPRPFVTAAAYFGPDRRRHRDPHYAGPERREAEPG